MATPKEFQTYFPKHETGVKIEAGPYFNLPSVVAKETLLYPLWIAQYSVNYRYQVRREFMNSFIFFYVKKGRLEFNYNGRRFSCKKNKACILDCTKTNIYHSNTNTEFIFMHFNGEPAKKIFTYLEQNKQQVVFDLSEKGLHYLDVLMNQMKDDQDTGIQKEIEYSVLIYHIFMNLIQSNVIGSSESYNYMQPPKFITKISNDIIKGYQDRNLSVTDLAQTINMGPGNLNRLFKKYTGKNIHQTIIKIRLEKAEAQLVNDRDATIAEVAEQNGFYDSAHMGKVFKKYLGKSPNEFRRINF